MAIRVIVVDDDPIVRQSICRIIDRSPDLAVVAKASNGQEAIDLCIKVDHDVVVMDMKLPDINGDEATRSILDAKPSTKVLGLSAFHEPVFVENMIDAGAAGFLFKPEDITDLLPAIRALGRGEAFYRSGGVSKALSMAENQSTQQTLLALLATLSPREREIFDLKVYGWRNFSIAKKLEIAESTVSCHVSNIMKKLQCNELTDLIRFASKAGCYE